MVLIMYTTILHKCHQPPRPPLPFQTPAAALNRWAHGSWMQSVALAFASAGSLALPHFPRSSKIHIRNDGRKESYDSVFLASLRAASSSPQLWAGPCFLLAQRIVIKLVGMRMVDYQSTPAHRPTFCWGCKTDTHMVDAKLQPLLINHSLL